MLALCVALWVPLCVFNVCFMSFVLRYCFALVCVVWVCVCLLLCVFRSVLNLAACLVYCLCLLVCSFCCFGGFVLSCVLCYVCCCLICKRMFVVC